MERSQEGRRNRKLAIALALAVLVLATAAWWLSRRTPTAELTRAAAALGARPARDIATADLAAAQLEPDPLGTSAIDASAPDVEVAGASIVAGCVRDERTQEPLAELTVELSGGGVRETCTTDAAGRFATRAVFPPAEVRAALTDLGWPVGSAELDHPRLPFDIAVPIGPTYPLRCDPWLPSGRLQVRLVEHTTGPWAALLEVDEQWKVRTVLDQEREAGVALVRGTAERWVRFPRPYLASSAEASAWLVLEDNLGQRWDEIAAPGTAGIRPAARFSADAGLGSIRGTVGQPAALWRRTRVCAVPADRADDARFGWHFADATRDHGFELVGLRAGSWRVVAYAGGLHPDEVIVDLRAEQCAILDLRLAEPAVDVQVAGSKRVAPRHVWAATPAALVPFHPPFRGAGPLDDLPRMPMQVHAQDIGHASSAEPPRALRTTWSGAGALRLDERPRLEPLEFEFLLGSAQKARAWFALGPGSCYDGVWPGYASVEVDPDEDVRWCAGAPGCQPVWGRLRDCRRTEAGLTTRVDLSPGWGAQLCAYELGFDASFAGVSAQRPGKWKSSADDAPWWDPDAAARSGPPLAVAVHPAAEIAAAREFEELGTTHFASPRAGTFGIAIDRVRFRIAEIRTDTGYTGNRSTKVRPGFQRYALACERRAPAAAAVAPAPAPDAQDVEAAPGDAEEAR